MKWLRSLISTEKGASNIELMDLKLKFEYFHRILDNNNLALKYMSDMEEKSQGEFVFDSNYIHNSLKSLRFHVEGLIDNMILLGGDEYKPLKEKYKEINNEIERFVCCKSDVVQKDKFTSNISDLNRNKVCSVGSKLAQLGEISSKLNIPVPSGFAVCAWAYKYFLDSNNLQEKISKMIHSVDIKNHDILETISQKIRELVSASPIPDDLASAITNSYKELKIENPEGFVSVRSSAIGEDTELSFAGQYATYLNVKEEDILSRYKDVLSSKFSPRAIYYYMSHSLEETDLAMSVGCLNMIDAESSGVIYTRNPVVPDEDSILISSIYGLGKLLVDGGITPDVFHVSRNTGEILNSSITNKPKRLDVVPRGGTIELEVHESLRENPSITDEQIKILYNYAIKIENHYGAPQDIEWAIDKKGQIYILQVRPLSIIRYSPPVEQPDTTNLKILLKGGTTGCPGAGGGKVYRIHTINDIANMPDDAILIAESPVPELITTFNRIKALITRVGATACHTVTVAREYRLPALVGVVNIDIIYNEQEITVDASNGIIYEGIHTKLIEALQPEYDYFEGDPLFTLLENILTKISPLNLLHPSDENFTFRNCKTFHDITRYVHQKAMEEMFYGTTSISRKQPGIKLKSNIPLQVDIIRLDKDLSQDKSLKFIREDEIDSLPMEALWGGVLAAGWPSQPPPPDFKGFLSVVATDISTNTQRDFSKNSFAILTKEFMALSLKMGYHFTTIESMCTNDPSKNYIKMQFKAGGASPDRRVRRIKLITDVLSKIGFQNSSKGDFLDTIISYESKDSIIKKLNILGRLSMLTKQLDMALSNEAIAEWYTTDIIEKLGLK